MKHFSEVRSILHNSNYPIDPYNSLIDILLQLEDEELDVTLVYIYEYLSGNGTGFLSEPIDLHRYPKLRSLIKKNEKGKKLIKSAIVKGTELFRDKLLSEVTCLKLQESDKRGPDVRVDFEFHLGKVRELSISHNFPQEVITKVIEVNPHIEKLHFTNVLSDTFYMVMSKIMERDTAVQEVSISGFSDSEAIDVRQAFPNKLMQSIKRLSVTRSQFGPAVVQHIVKHKFPKLEHLNLFKSGLTNRDLISILTQLGDNIPENTDLELRGNILKLSKEAGELARKHKVDTTYHYDPNKGMYHE